ncbi:MAG: glycine oxidase ThiO [Actinomycetota bacterium]|nr:glycine oxidase ThiO [Actinomycetota bacterium]
MCDVAIIGGGVIGLSIAWKAAEAGMSVTVLDPDVEGAASSAAAGMLAPVTEAHFGEEPLLALNLASARAYPQFAAELEKASGEPSGYRDTGTLAVARDLDDRAALDRLARFQTSAGLQVERLRSRECRVLEPGLASSIRGGVFVRDDHQVDNRALLVALRAASERSGVVARRIAVRRITIEGDRATGVEVDGGEHLRCGRCVLAAGAWSALVAGLPDDARPAVRPVKGQLLHLNGVPETVPQHTIRGAGVYMVPRGDGRLVVGASVEEKGFDTSVAAGAVHDLLRDAYELYPGVAELELSEVAVGLRPGTPDNAPLLGETRIRDLIVATGHYRNGILLAPITARTIAHLLSTGETPLEIQAFSPRRFGSAREAVL